MQPYNPNPIVLALHTSEISNTDKINHGRVLSTLVGSKFDLSDQFENYQFLKF